MSPYLYLLAIAVVMAALWLYAKRHHKSRKQNPPLADRIRKEGSEVRCFTCGIWVPKEGALEKKGRYFCGIKKSERANTGTAEDVASTSKGS